MADEDFTHPILGKAKLQRKLFGQAVIYELPVKNFNQTSQWHQRMKTVPNSSAIFLPDTVEKIEKKGNNSLKLKYGSFIYLLEDEKQNRIRFQIPFTEQQLWYVLYTLLQTSKEMTSKGLPINNINGSTILLDHYGNIRIFTEYSVPHYHSLVSKNDWKAPEEAKAILNKQSLNLVQKSKAEVFEIGITLIEMSLLQSCQHLFKIKPHVDQKQLSKMLSRVSQGYSTFFKNCIQLMTQNNASDRPTASEMWAMLYPYSAYINMLEPFKPQRKISESCLATQLLNERKK